MRIWIINYYAGTPETAGNPRYLKLAKHFMGAGHEVITFDAGSTAHIADSEFQGTNFVERQYDGYRFVHVRVPHFEGNGVKRMLSIWKFAQIILKGRNKFERPDVILQNIHPRSLGLVAGGFRYLWTGGCKQPPLEGGLRY